MWEDLQITNRLLSHRPGCAYPDGPRERRALSENLVHLLTHYAGCAKASGSASCSPCRNGEPLLQPSASRLLPTDTASRRSLETCAARSPLHRAPARFPPRPFRLSRKLSFGLHPDVGNNRLHFLFALAFHSFRFFTSLGRNRNLAFPLYAFGVHPLSGLWVTRND